MAGYREELIEYLEQVVREVERRQAVVRMLETEIQNIERELTSLKQNRVSDVRTLQSQSGFRQTLRRKIESKKLELQTAQDDLIRAQEREATVRSELEEQGE